MFWTGPSLNAYELQAVEQLEVKAHDGETLELTMSELALFLEGSELAGKVPLSPSPFVFSDVGAF